jgi:hypothetical protein
MEVEKVTFLKQQSAAAPVLPEQRGRARLASLFFHEEREEEETYWRFASSFCLLCRLALISLAIIKYCNSRIIVY